MDGINLRRSQLRAALLLACTLAAGIGIGAQGGAIETAQRFIEQNRQALGLTGSDTRDIVVTSALRDSHNGLTHVYFQQRYRGIEVFNAVLNISVKADGTVLTAGNRFVPNLAAAAGGQQPTRSAVEAAGHAAGHLGLRPTEPFQILASLRGTAEVTRLSTAGIAEKPIEVGLTWVPTGNGRVRLAWKVAIDVVAGDHWWQALVDAETGESLGVVDLVVSDNVDAIVAATARPAAETAGTGSTLAAFNPTDGAVYNVFPLPFESPSDGPRSLVTNAADPLSSPFGWHDTDGAPGAEFTRTQGNNVHAYTDVDANNVADPGSDPDGGALLTFDFPLDLSQNPEAYRPAAVTNLFYWNNIMHDVTYRYGFTEAAGNFQVDNYGNGGLGNDYVRAEAQDGSGTNNANFGTPVDGNRPRMQMFVWTHPLPNIVTIDAPSSGAGNYAASGAAFGPTVAETGPLNGSIVLVNDGAGLSNSDGCEPFVGFVAGSIALLDRGNCTFVVKAGHAQAAGAIAVLAANNAPGGPITMGGTDATIVIPSVMVGLDDGNVIKAGLPATGTLRANALTSINRDSDLDAGVIAHEYGHGISNRLTGGPAIVSCLNNAEQMGEGWSDWFAMALTTRPSDVPTTARGVGSYVNFEPPDGAGIRPTPYSTDMAVNPATYTSVADTANISQPHGIGYVWNTMLWEMYWNLVDRHGYNADIYGAWSTGGNNMAMQLVMDGLKLQACLPGFVDGRNAILMADAALTGGANQCEIWRGFAKRGLGFSANQGLSTSRVDGVEAFDLPASCMAATFGGFKPPVANAPAVNHVNAGRTIPLMFTLEGPLNGIDSQPVDCTSLVPTGEAPTALASPSPNGTSYHLNWRTDRAWAGSCRRVTLRLPAADDAVAYFQFR